MPAVQTQTSLAQELARVIHSVGHAIKTILTAEPVPYWADYLRDERQKSR